MPDAIYNNKIAGPQLSVARLRMLTRDIRLLCHACYHVRNAQRAQCIQRAMHRARNAYNAHITYNAHIAYNAHMRIALTFPYMLIIPTGLKPKLQQFHRPGR